MDQRFQSVLEAERGSLDIHDGLVSPKQILPDVIGNGIEVQGQGAEQGEHDDEAKRGSARRGEDDGRKEDSEEEHAGDYFSVGLFRTVPSARVALYEVNDMEEEGIEQRVAE